ncbi:sensor histidine kinase [Quadrisphaera sp. KR29]|uniref:sensor histidine kinase n=1 Tax=Quadrisphaera sp. KR29 TaxID=3461391 RepID=UPI0040448A02
MLFGITALLLLGVYLALSHSVPAAPLDPVTVQKFTRASDGTVQYRSGEQFQAADLASVQLAVNYASLQTLRTYSLIALAVMFVLSLVVGWWVAGRTLRPLGHIVATTRHITATDLSRRIGASGPPDELRTLADTIDGMLQRLEEAFTTERRLVEDVSHELRNPVAVITTNVEAVLGDERSTPADRADATGVVLRATARMSRLLDDLLATARKRSGAFQDSDIDVARLTQSVTQEHHLMAQQRSLALQVSSPAGPVVYGDATAISRALSNLLSNAVRLAPTGSTISVSAGSRAGWAWIAVQDQGPGVPEVDRERIFHRFHRGSDEPSGGTGLGLAIARQIVESHDGRLVLEGTDGSGSRFTIWLPDRAVSGGPERATKPPVA